MRLTIALPEGQRDTRAKVVIADGDDGGGRVELSDDERDLLRGVRGPPRVPTADCEVRVATSVASISGVGVESSDSTLNPFFPES